MDSELFRIVASAQSSYVSDHDLPAIATELLRSLLELTEAGYGFVARIDSADPTHVHLLSSVRLRPGRAPEVARGHEAMALSEGGVLARAIESRAPRVTEAGRDSGPVRGLPSGAPHIANAVVLPFPSAAKPVGLMLLANRRGSWSAADLAQLGPAIDTCASLFSADATQKKLHEREQLHRAVVDAVPDGVLTLDGAGAVVSANPAARELLGRPDLVGHGLVDLLGPGGDVVAAALAKVDSDGEVPAGSLVVSMRRGTEALPIEVRLRSAGTDGTLIAVLRDLTEHDRLLRERARVRTESDRMKSEFVSIVSHELRTPLTAIRGSLGLLDGGAVGALEPPQRDLLGLALANTERLVQLVNDILDLDRLTRAGAQLRPVQMPAIEPVSMAVDSVSTLLESTGTELKLDLAPGLLVHADKDRLVQVLVSLIGNAVKFGGAESTVTIVGRSADGGALLGVRDQGPGLPGDGRQLLFEPFAQGDSSDSRPKGGIGLGLAICRSIIEQHGGWIDVAAQPDRGSFFHFLLPAPRRSTR